MGHTTNQTNKVSLNHEFDAVDVIDIYPNAGSFALLDVNHNLYLINDTNQQNLTVDIPILSGVKKVVSSFEPENDGSGKNQYFVLLENGDLKQLDVSLKRENFDGFNSNDDIHNIASDVVDFHYIGHNFVKTEKADGSISVSEINPHLFNTISIEESFGDIFPQEKNVDETFDNTLKILTIDSSEPEGGNIDGGLMSADGNLVVLRDYGMDEHSQYLEGQIYLKNISTGEFDLISCDIDGNPATGTQWLCQYQTMGVLFYSLWMNMAKPSSTPWLQ